MAITGHTIAHTKTDPQSVFVCGREFFPNGFIAKVLPAMCATRYIYQGIFSRVCGRDAHTWDLVTAKILVSSAANSALSSLDSLASHIILPAVLFNGGQ